METVGKQVGRMPDTRTFGPTNKLVCSSTYVGYELEVENMPHVPKPLSDLWSSKEDRSLRDRGMEFVFTRPLKGQDVVTAMEELYLGLSTKKPVFSHRCGTHVHIDVRDMSVHQLTSFVVHSLVFERAMYAFAGAGRDSNIFCLPYYKASAGIRGIGQMLRSGNVNALLERADKYYGVNFSAIGRYGSIEFRMLPGTGDLGRAMTWINVLLAIRKAAVAATKVESLLTAMSARGVIDYARDVFSGVPEFLDFVTEKDMYQGMRLAQAYLDDEALAEASTMLPTKLHSRSLAAVFAKKQGIKLTGAEPVKAKEPEPTPEGANPGLWDHIAAMQIQEDAQRQRVRRIGPLDFNAVEEVE